MADPVLNRRLELEEPRKVPDGAGGFVETWVTLGALWAELRAGPAAEREGDFLTLSTVAYRITVRAAPVGAPSRPRPDQRLREPGRLFRIIAVAELGTDGRFLVCHAREEVAT